MTETESADVWLPCGARYMALAGHKDALARKDPLPQGYLWQYGKKYGFAETFELAQAWVEALAVHYSIPADKRWMTL